ncbi:MAG: glycogen debranching enzyme N-terminal domain-containing protein [Acidobacteria bacterium]|nr:glycogen debranching enzyme N-terminal domain-containing protein [Acidobacteriota bacterium]
MINATIAVETGAEPIRIEGPRCRDWAQASELEWLETNGLGGFAMGTVAGANVRRYHGLLVAALCPPLQRMMLLSRVEEELLCEGEQTILGAAQYPGTVSPAGFRFLEGFRLDPFPVWTYGSGCAQVEKAVFLLQDQHTVVLRYRVDRRCRLRVRPFLAFRDYHSLQHENGSFRCAVEEAGARLTVRPFADLPAMHLHHNAEGFVGAGHWYGRNEYRKEMERGLDFQEDLYSPGWLDFELKGGETAFVAATIESLDAVTLEMVAQWEQGERERRRVNPGGGDWGELRARLELAADQFLVHRADGSPTIIAGYPWFTDWGRDTMISLPGLLIARGGIRDAERIIAGFLAHMDRGVIPNRFPDSASEQPEYNTVDGTLWLFPAAWALQQAGESEHFLRETFYPAAKEILDWHVRGTHYDIRVDAADGLLSAGGAGTQLTWMDAKVGDWVVTPRHGKAVEINALWYNALRMMAWWAGRMGEFDQALEWASMADRVQRSFRVAFVDEEHGGLYDRITADGPDDRVRPNQVFALSLPFALLEGAAAESVLRVVEERLVTPFGLRTLEAGHPEYRARYEGGPRERDGAYHQGTVWPWLIGPFLSARLRVYGASEENLEFVKERLLRFGGEMSRGCLGTVAELYHAEAPQTPTGAMAQAWSVAELLRVMAELEACANGQ